MKYLIAFLAITISTIALAGMYFEKKDAQLISSTYNYTNVEIKWSEGTNTHTKYYAHYVNAQGKKCANVFYIGTDGAKAQPWENCSI